MQVSSAEAGAADGRHRLVRFARWALVVLVAGAVVWSVAGQWRAVRHDLGRIGAGWLAAAGVVTVVAVAAPVLSWAAALRATGSTVPLRPAARVFFVGQLGKYVPGSVWPLVAQMELGRRYGFGRQQIALGGLLQLALSVLVAGGLGLLVLPLSGQLPGWEVALVVVALAVGVAVLIPRVLGWLLGRVLMVLRRPPLSSGIDGRATAVSIGWAAVASLGLAAQAALLARGLGADGAGTALAGGALLLGIALGVLVIPVPAGAGIREATVVLLLRGHLGTAEATALALLSRLLLAGMEVAFAGVGFGLGRRVGVAPPSALPEQEPVLGRRSG